MKTASALAVLLAAATLASAPAALGQRCQNLFTLARTYNTNIVNYDAQFGKDGKLDPKEPVVCYWIIKEDKGQREGLNFIEKKAYGFNCKPDSSGRRFTMILNAIKGRMVKVYVEADSARAEFIIAGRPSFLERIKIQSKGKLGKPPFLEVFGRDVETGAAQYEKIMSD